MTKAENKDQKDNNSWAVEETSEGLNQYIKRVIANQVKLIDINIKLLNVQKNSGISKTKSLSRNMLWIS